MCPCFNARSEYSFLTSTGSNGTSNVNDEYEDLSNPTVVPDEPIGGTDDTSGQEEQQEPWTGPSIGPGEPPVTPEKPKEVPISFPIFILKVLI